MSAQIQALLFDADGTLIDSEGPGMDVLHRLAVEHGVVFSREQAHERFRGLRMGDVVAWVARQIGRDTPDFHRDFTAQARQAQYERFRQGVAAMPGAHDLLRRLRIPYCVATNGPREKVELTLQLCGLRPWFGDRVFSAYEVQSFKPEPGLFLHAAARLGVAPEHCGVVEDSVPGMLAGLAAGMRVFSLLPSPDTPADLRGRVTFISGLDGLTQHLNPDVLGAA